MEFLILGSLYAEHRYLLENDTLYDEEKTAFREILAKTADEETLIHSIRKLSEYLYRYHGISSMLLIDEYDTPIQESYIHGYYDDFIIFMRGLFGAGLKDNKWFAKAVITGITRVAKEGLFSGVNNLDIYTFMQSRYSNYFGFSETEVKELFNKAEVAYNANLVRSWYNGYRCGEATLYNPWSILKCIKENGKP